MTYYKLLTTTKKLLVFFYKYIIVRVPYYRVIYYTLSGVAYYTDTHFLLGRTRARAWRRVCFIKQGRFV